MILFRLITNLLKAKLMIMSVIYCKSGNEFHYSPPWRGVGVGLLKIDIHFSGLQYFTGSSNKRL